MKWGLSQKRRQPLFLLQKQWFKRIFFKRYNLLKRFLIIKKNQGTILELKTIIKSFLNMPQL